MAGDAPNPNLATGEVQLFTGEFAACPQPVYQRLVAGCPVARAAIVGSPVISRYEDVVWALRHPEIFSSAMEAQMNLGTERPMIPQQIDPPAQTKFRKILDPRFSKRRMAEIEPEVRRHANELIDAFVATGECEFDRDFAVPLPCTAFLALLDLPNSELGFFLRLKDGIIRPQTQIDPGLDTAAMMEAATRLRKETGREIYAYFDDVIDRRRAKPGGDMISYLLETEIDGEKLTREEILDVSFLLILAGLDTVTATLGCSVAYLAANDAQRQKLVGDPSQLAGAVEELLRWETPVTAVPRLLKRDVEIGGTKLAKGQMVTLLLGAANVDAGEFPEPARVDFEREHNRHIAFGAGAHRIPEYRIKPGEEPRYTPGIREVQYLPLVWERA